ncbi:hypothetical protein GZ777_000062 [Enterococcus faecium]|nr:hypothetical protein [Enterococcus faecium]
MDQQQKELWVTALTSSNLAEQETIPLTLTRELVDKYMKWDEQSITARAKELSSEALSIWKFPIKTDVEVLPSIAGEHYLDEDINITGNKPKLLSIDEKEFKVDSWKKLLLTFLDFVWEVDSRTFANLKKKEALKRLFDIEEMRNPGMLSNGDSIETNFSAETILSIVKLIAVEYDIFEDISYTI